jgi:hypothetical protein
VNSQAGPSANNVADTSDNEPLSDLGIVPRAPDNAAAPGNVAAPAGVRR